MSYELLIGVIAVANEISRLGHQEIIKPLPSEAFQPITCNL
ncbi:hypothetical protein Nos7524_4095 [Nostoc sp. PCC 7524]|nr:hypothetical protein Nos7524_4095 [Nostoc sp. PCC 7524]